MTDKRKEDLYRRYLSRELSPEELKEFFAMLGTVSKADDLAGLDEVNTVFSTTFEPKRNIAHEILHAHKTKSALSIWLKRTAAAAAIVAVLITAYHAYVWQDYLKQTTTFTTVKVPFGTLTEIKLGDGTQVSLASGSVFKYPKLFSKKERRVYLIQGQAFFRVAHDKTKPFRVNSGKLSTTALGTSFMVRNYKNYNYEKVSLYTGKVRVDRNGIKSNPVILHPGQEYNYHNGLLSTITAFDNAVKPDNQNILTFKRTPFYEAIYEMSSFYGVNIKFNDTAFKNFSITGSFSNQKVNEVLHSLTFIYPINVIKTDSLTYNLTLIDKH
jgi:transmembrane sensor